MMVRLNFIVSAANCAVFPVSYIVRTLHVPMVVVVLVGMMVFSLTASCLLWLSTTRVMRPPAGGPPSVWRFCSNKVSTL
ncbi:hypothetical protein DPMN_088767 [Dreissena polymorpha]|uniref:Uncharacterized protein n=1 Tax=Dreissena polymorpha TaxID=45954 RepID=A0A9D4QWP9_DREPO|nr:hypothetical protein DPMN_088767 [Dreissena polymorpha]